MPSLRRWLTRKQQETRRGRAELLLAERAALWNAKPHNRHLPSIWEWCRITLLTRHKYRTEPHRKMMRRATGFYIVRACAALVVLAAAVGAGFAICNGVAEQQQRIEAASLVKQILAADTRDTRDLLDKVAKLEGFRRWADDSLREEYRNATEDSKQRLHASLGLLPVDAAQAAYLQQRLLAENDPVKLATIRDFLGTHVPADTRRELRDSLWRVLEDAARDAGERFRAACALATFDTAEAVPDTTRWVTVGPFVAEQLSAAGTSSLRSAGRRSASGAGPRTG